MNMTVTSSQNNARVALREKLKEWRAALFEEQNAILNSIYLLTDSLIAQFIFSNQAIFPKIPDFVARQIHNGFSFQHFILVRRLAEDPENGLLGPRGVYSLPAVLGDVAKHCNLLTRRALFTVQSPDLEYDEAVVCKAVVCKKEAD